MKKSIVLFLLLVSTVSFAQELNDYKYAIVPSKFPFLKEKDQYRMNTFTKMFMEKYGFVTFFDTDILPTEAGNQNCNKVFVTVESEGSIFATKVKIILKDCRNVVLYTSEEGKSREKEYKLAYTEALRNAFKSFETLGYHYNGTVMDVEKSVVKTINDGTTVTKEVVVVKPEVAQTGSQQPVDTKDLLFAQPMENGYQLIDITPKVVLKIRNTSTPNVFLAERDQLKGIVIPKNGKWAFEYYADGKLVSEILNIKF